jgi:hypothetical protein
MALAATTIAPASTIDSNPAFIIAQQAPSTGATSRPPNPGARPSARPRPTMAPTRKPPPRPTAAPTRRPPPRPTAAPTNRPPPRPTMAPTRRPPPRPTASPWKPNRPPNYRPPNNGWHRPAWANQPRPPWVVYNGRRPNYILVNPRPYAYNWGWNNGNQWYPHNQYWGGGFWGPFSIFALTAGQALWSQNRYASPAYSSPGWYLFQNYGLQYTQCGRQNLVYIYGPNNSVMCAYPNEYVLAGAYYVDPATLQLLVM